MYDLFDTALAFVLGLYCLLFTDFISQKMIHRMSWKTLGKKPVIRIAGMVFFLEGIAKCYEMFFT